MNSHFLPKQIKVFAPATVANVGPGFDILGFAVDGIGDTVEARRISEKKVIIAEITGDNGALSRNVEENVAGLTTLLVWEKTKPSFGIELKLHKGMGLGTGLGSSGASAAAGAYAANMLMERPMEKHALLPFCMEGEKLADGSYHLDNAGASLLGGFLFIRSYDPIEVLKLPANTHLYVLLVCPKIKILTKDARAVLPKNIPLSTMTKQVSNCSSLITSLFLNDKNLLKKSLEDVVIEPARAHLIPGFYEMKEEALRLGALGFSISGAGPSVFAFANDKKQADEIGVAMQNILKNHAIVSTTHVSTINRKGAYMV